MTGRRPGMSVPTGPPVTRRLTRMSRDRVVPRLTVVGDTAPSSDTRPNGPVRVARGEWPALGRSGKVALWLSVATGLLTHGYHLFRYPLYLTDEGIYMQR